MEQIARSSVLVERSNDVPADLIAAQCALESGWLSFAPGNNCFGIKWYALATGRQLLHTHEWFTPLQVTYFLKLLPGRTAQLDPAMTHPDVQGRMRYIVQDYFATFLTLEACFRKRALLFNAPVYREATQAWRKRLISLSELVTRIGPIYATSPIYTQSVLEIIRDAQLQNALGKARQWANS